MLILANLLASCAAAPQVRNYSPPAFTREESPYCVEESGEPYEWVEQEYVISNSPEGNSPQHAAKKQRIVDEFERENGEFIDPVSLESVLKNNTVPSLTPSSDSVQRLYSDDNQMQIQPTQEANTSVLTISEQLLSPSSSNDSLLTNNSCTPANLLSTECLDAAASTTQSVAEDVLPFAHFETC